MDMESLITLDDAIADLHVQLNALSHRFTVFISSWLQIKQILRNSTRQFTLPVFLILWVFYVVKNSDNSLSIRSTYPCNAEPAYRHDHNVHTIIRD